MIAGREGDRRGAVADVVEQRFPVGEAGRVGHRQDRLDVRLTIDHVGPPARLRLDSAPFAQRELPVSGAEEKPAQLLDAVGDRGRALCLLDGSFELRVAQRRPREKSGERDRRDGHR